MAKTVCHECGAVPCYLICPMADPFHGDQRAEDAAYEEGARLDEERAFEDAQDASIAEHERWLLVDPEARS